MNHYRLAKFLTHLLDTQFSVGGISFGLDPLLDFIPGLGDVIGLVLSVYIIWIAKGLGVPEKEVAVMARNVIIDFIIGLIPVVGIVGDAFYKANVKNLRIIERHLEKPIIEG